MRNKHTSQMTERELRLEASRIKVAFAEKGITHMADFLQAFFPEHKIPKHEVQAFVYHQAANAQLVDMFRLVLEIIEK